MLKSTIPNIFWISSEGIDNLIDGFMRIAKNISAIPEAYLSDRTLVVSAVKKWLERSTQDWLLVFDNVLDNAELTEFWPSTERGRILITTRHAGTLHIDARHSAQITQ